MKRWTQVMVLMIGWICGASSGSMLGPDGSVGSGVSAYSIGEAIAVTSNCRVIYPGDSVQTAYDNLKNSGTWTATNRASLILLGPGTFSGPLVADTEYVDLYGQGGPPESIILSRGTGGPAVTQSADNIILSGFTIKNTTESGSNGDHGLYINCENPNSIYYNMRFRHAQPGRTSQGSSPWSTAWWYPVYGPYDLSGTWSFCEGDDFSWRVADGNDITSDARFYLCRAGQLSWGGDQGNNPEGTGELNGYYYGCEGGVRCFGGCGVFGTNIGEGARFYFCKAGSESWAISKEFAGKAFFCEGGADCFAGYDISAANYGLDGNTFSGEVHNCIVGAGSCGAYNSTYGDPTKQYFKGRLYNTPVIRVGQTTAVSPVKASYTTTFTDPNANIVVSAQTYGTQGNSNLFQCQFASKSANINIGTGAVSIRPVDSTTTASDIVALLEADDWFKGQFKVELVGDGSGDMDEEIEWTNFAGGAEGVCTESYPIECKYDYDIPPGFSGMVITNATATAEIDITLPAATVGQRYIIADIEWDAGEDVEVIPQTGESLYLADGSTPGVSDSVFHTADNITGVIEFYCFKAGQWQSIREVSTWADVD